MTADIFQSACELLKQVPSENVVSKKTLTQFTGTLSNTANLIPWPPSLSKLRVAQCRARFLVFVLLLGKWRFHRARLLPQLLLWL